MSATLTKKSVRTRKPHRCWGCWRMFPAGTAMQYTTGVGEGGFWAAHWCSTCTAYENSLSWSEYGGLYADGVDGGDYSHDERWQEIRAKLEPEPSPSKASDNA